MEDKDVYAQESIGRVIECGGRYVTLVNGNLLIKGYFTRLTGDKAILDDLALKLDSSTKVYTEDSDALRDKAALDFSIVADTASSYGSNHNILAPVLRTGTP